MFVNLEILIYLHYTTIVHFSDYCLLINGEYTGSVSVFKTNTKPETKHPPKQSSFEGCLLDVNINSHILESIHLFIARILGEVSFNYILCDRYCH